VQKESLSLLDEASCIVYQDKLRYVKDSKDLDAFLLDNCLILAKEVSKSNIGHLKLFKQVFPLEALSVVDLADVEKGVAKNLEALTTGSSLLFLTHLRAFLNLMILFRLADLQAHTSRHPRYQLCVCCHLKLRQGGVDPLFGTQEPRLRHRFPFLVLFLLACWIIADTIESAWFCVLCAALWMCVFLQKIKSEKTNKPASMFPLVSVLTCGGSDSLPQQSCSACAQYSPRKQT